ncbi:hypothetical protein [Erythrobacter sp. F6033]|uniref:hypothetical protein n=1 Tax=Erythrobacter sp. F6033 TaxID=2926401 RepID=UPI001FF5FB9F|nr:hypothetical protein [Erythrobacter sp. F6033]MCK0128748.1 hypothetical protein [Erythrobacter sp. F6033]
MADNNRRYQSLTGLSSLWWPAVVMGLFTLLAVVMTAIAPFTVVLVLLLTVPLIFVRAGAAGRTTIVAGFTFLAAIFFGIPMVSKLIVYSDLGKYDRPSVTLAEKIEWNGDLLIATGPRQLERFLLDDGLAPSGVTLDMLLIYGQTSSVTLAEYEPTDFEALSADIDARHYGAKTTFSVSPSSACQDLLRRYREGFNGRTTANQIALKEWRSWRAELTQNCVIQQATPTDFAWKMRFGGWRNEAAADIGDAPINIFGFSHGPGYRSYRPYRPGVWVKYAEIVGPDGSIKFRAFGQNAYALAAPLQLNSSHNLTDVSFAHTRFYRGSGISEAEYKLLPESLRRELRSLFWHR